MTPSKYKPWEILLWVLVLATPLLLPTHAAIINEIAIVALFAVSLDLVLGYTGIVSLGHAAFFGMAAYGSALFAKHINPDPLLGLAVGIVLATLLGALCSLTIIRGSDLTRLMVTLGMGLILYELANNCRSKRYRTLALGESSAHASVLSRKPSEVCAGMRRSLASSAAICSVLCGAFQSASATISMPARTPRRTKRR